MQRVRMRLQNCYGIGRLDYDFDFSRLDAFSVYAPNGFMKTSLIQTLLDYSKGQDSRDRHYPDRPTVVDLRDESDEPLPPAAVYAVPPLVDSFSVAPSSLLLVNDEARRRYETAARTIQDKTATLLKQLKSRSGLNARTRTPETDICECFGEDDLLALIDSLEDEIEAEHDAQISQLSYSRLFSDDALGLFKSGDLIPQLTEYIATFNQLVESSPILTRGFNHYNAATVQQSLSSNGFFRAQHSVTLNDGQGGEVIRTADDLQQALDRERSRVLSDDGLSRRFDAIEKKLGRQGLRDLRDYLAENQWVIPLLADYRLLQRQMWLAFLSLEAAAYRELLAAYRDGSREMRAAVEQAETERTDWVEVVEQFNRRFKVPFQVRVENVADVVLKQEAPRLAFQFVDSEGDAPVAVKESDLVRSLSLGERRALYLLNILFEIRLRSVAEEDTLLVFDDVADSFDYRNKYAIIEYIAEVCRQGRFKVVVLTHNFDFHRTLCRRLYINLPDHRLYAVRTGRVIELRDDPYYRDTPFHHWRGNLSRPEVIVASIPFVRNLAEYCGCDEALDALTCLLHVKAAGEATTIAQLEEAYRLVLQDEPRIEHPDRDARVVELISETADRLLEDTSDHVALEDKIVLSIATRRAAERYMIRRIDDDEWVTAIRRNQTRQLAERYRQRFLDSPNLPLVDRVCLITPEAIHLNAFMYEPILDMSPAELRSLYADVRDQMTVE